MTQRRGGDPHRDRVDALYREPSSNFIAARNALASALKREGEADAAERVKHLAKPSPSAWALNQVYWRERPLFDRMIKAGDALRTLQQRMLAGKAASPRDAMAERQSAVHDVVERAAAFLKEDGNQVTAATRQRLATSADALASYGSAAEYVPGRLTEDIDAPGFAALATLGSGAGLRLVHSTPEPPPPAKPHHGASPPAKTKAAPAPDPKAERQAAREREAAVRRLAAERSKAIRAAEQALRDAGRELDAVRQRAERARAAAEAAAQEQQSAEEQLARVTARRRAADAAAVAAADAVEAAERGRRDAEAALAAARAEAAARG
jgi:hypothetical protein